MKSRALTWILLLFLVLILGGITTGLTTLLMEFDRKDHISRHLDQTEGWDRALLWHLESHLGQFITTENARPYEDYLSPDTGNAFVFDSDLVSCYFHVEPGRTLTHPQETEPHLLKLIANLKTDAEKEKVIASISPDMNAPRQDQVPVQTLNNSQVREFSLTQQQEKQEVSNPDQIIRRLNSERAQQDYLFRSQAAENAYSKKTIRSNFWNNSVPEPESFSTVENHDSSGTISSSSFGSFFGGKFSSKDQNLSVDLHQAYDDSIDKLKLRKGKASAPIPYVYSEPDPPPIVIKEGILKPEMLYEVLMLKRTVQHSGEVHVQGLLIPWKRLQQWAEEKTLDLGRTFTLHPSNLSQSFPLSYKLAMIPAILVTQELHPPPYQPSLNIQGVLLAFWSAMGFAVLILTFLFLGILKLSKRRGMFASAVTHELRTPLTTFSMYTEMLDEGMVQDPEKQKKYIQVLRRESDRLSHLVENVLAFSRLEQRKLNLVKEARDLDAFVEQILSRGVELARQKGVPLQQDLPKELFNFITRSDPDHVGQIVFNMIENAIKYGCPHSNSPIELTLTLKRKKLLLTVRDHGPGVSPTFRRRLFRPFSKSDRDAADTSHGVGLGLALCRSLARQLGGDLRFIKVQPGACFQLSLPIEKKS